MKPEIIHFHWCAAHDLSDGAECALNGCLSPEEAQNARRCRHAADRKTYVVSHALKRHVLAAATGRPPRQWDFTRGTHGKPRPITRAHEPDLRINISHTRGLAITALSVAHEVGVDVEWFHRPNILRVAKRFYAEDEWQQVKTAKDEGDRHRLAVGIWTLKEAYLKAKGTGLTVPLDSFAVQLSPPQLLYDSVQDPRHSVQLFRVAIGPDVAAAVAVDLGGDPRPVRVQAARVSASQWQVNLNHRARTVRTG